MDKEMIEEMFKYMIRERDKWPPERIKGTKMIMYFYWDDFIKRIKDHIGWTDET